MYIRTLESCAIAEIDQLKSYPDSKAAMMAFCKQVFEGGIWFRDNKEDKARPGAMISFYVFSAPSNYPYGENFAKLIKEEKFGDVWASEPRLNKAYHPDHSNKMWVWTPDRDALFCWYNDHKAKTVVKKKVGPGV